MRRGVLFASMREVGVGPAGDILYELRAGMFLCCCGWIGVKGYACGVCCLRASGSCR